jgi:signal transduction histidine kinase
MRINLKSIKSKIFLFYALLLIGVIFFSNIAFYYLSKRYFYNYTVEALKSISRDVLSDDIRRKHLKNGITIAEHKYKFSIPNVYIQAKYKNKIILKSKNLKSFDLPMHDTVKEGVYNINIPNQSRYKFLIYTTSTQDGYTIQIATTYKEIEHDLEKILHMFFIWDPIVVSLILLLMYKMLTDIIKPMNTIIETAKNISITDLDKKIPYKDNGDEFAELAKTFNNMLSRLQASFMQIKRFNSDASHQLKTPLASIRIQTEIALRSEREPKEYQEILNSINSETIHLQEMIDNLFLLTQMDDEIIKNNFKKINVDDVLINVIEEFVPIADKKGINLQIGKIQPFSLKSEPTLLFILCSNLIDNALKYTPKGKSIFIELYNNTLTVKDQGIGISKKHLKRIFDKFFRVEPSRSNDIKGYGLGLSIVRTIVKLHNAHLLIKSKKSEGTTIKVNFSKKIIDNKGDMEIIV